MFTWISLPFPLIFARQSLPARRLFSVQATRACGRAGARRNIVIAPVSENPAVAREAYLKQLAQRLEAQKKQHHYDQAEEVFEASKWLKVSAMVAFPLCILSSIKDLILNEHEHASEGPKPDYMKIMNKDFPWECKECALFDPKCWAECRANKE
jgi:cytochrome c oxidase subunit 6a